MNATSPGSAGDRLERAVAALRSLPAPSLPAEVLQQTRTEVLSAPTRFQRMRLRSLATGGVAATMLVGLTLLLIPGRSSQALAEVAAQVEKTKTLRARAIVEAQAGGTLFLSGSKMRYDGPKGGESTVSDFATGRQVVLDHRAKTAIHVPIGAAAATLDLYSVFRNLDRKASTAIDDYLDANGRRFPGQRGIVTLTDQPGSKFDVRVWSDPATKLPVRLEMTPQVDPAGDSKLLLEDIVFDEPLDASLFGTDVPPGYKIVGGSPDQLKPAPPEAAQLTITPKVGVGKAKFGMSRAEIVAVMGEPASTLHDIYLNYPMLGLQLVLVGREPDKLGMIIANPYDLHSKVRNDFPGQTDKGIRIGSTREQVVAAYGKFDPPNPQSKRPAELAGGYAELRLGFGFTDGKVNQIIISGD